MGQSEGGIGRWLEGWAGHVRDLRMMADELKSERSEERSHKYVGGETALVFQMSCSSEQKVDLE